MKKVLLIALLIASPVAAQDHTAIVASVKADLQARGVDTSGPCGAFAITKRVAWMLRGEGAGLLSKPSGNNCEGFATDIIAYPGGHIFDMLVSGGDVNGPSWQDAGLVDASRYRAAIDPGDMPQPPVVLPPVVLPPTPPAVFDAAALAAQIAQLQLSLDTHVRGLSEAIAVVNQNVSDGRADNRSAWAKVADHWKSITMVAAPVITWWTTRQMQQP